METVELAAAFDRAVGERLIAAERLVLTLPELFHGTLRECDLAYRLASRFFVVVARVESASQARGRLEFWCARAGSRYLSPSALSEHDRSAFYLYMGECDLKRISVPTGELAEAVGQMITEAGAPATRKRPAVGLPVLVIDVEGPGWKGVEYSPSEQTLFVPGVVTPPAGDEMMLSLRFHGVARPLETRAQVAAVRTLGEADVGAPAGFTLRFISPPQPLVSALGGAKANKPLRRSAPRYPVRAPVRIEAEEAPTESTVRIEYATEQELAADYVDNLSQGGAFVRTARPQPVGSSLILEMRLPAGIELRAKANVVYLNAIGMGVKFELDDDAQETLAGVIARISARPRRALVVDDDALARRMLADALIERGFEVLSANDGAEGLRILTEELLALDILVTDLQMPKMDGETFIKAIRSTGGENELTIVAVSGRLENGMEARLETAGADAVLEKELGPVLIAQAADAALERKRLLSDGGETPET